MGVSNSGYTFQVELAIAKTPQQIDPQTTTPGSENPQTETAAIKAKSGNVGTLFIGFSKQEVESEGAGFEVGPGEIVSVDIGTLGKVWFNGANAKDGFCVMGVGP